VRLQFRLRDDRVADDRESSHFSTCANARANDARGCCRYRFENDLTP